MKAHRLKGLVVTSAVMFLIAGNAGAQVQPCSVAVLKNYAGWGWESYVMRNGLITVAVVPEIGGRVMQYDLDGHPSIYVNPDELGKRYTPSNDSPWHNYGGYKMWPAPQDQWIVGGGGWPPPPNLDFGAYACQIMVDLPDSSVIYLESPVETLSRWKCHNLKFERRMTIYRGSTRVKVEQTIINKGDQAVRWGIWDVTQSIVNHPGQTDYANFWVYFPIKADSKFGEKGYYVMSGSKDNPQWKGNIAEGVSAVQYLHHGGKVGADSDAGWICYVDEKGSYTYAKKFTHFAGEIYPDNGASVEVYTSPGLPYLEVEVLSPLVDLGPNESYTFVEDWYAARCHGPILEVNQAGVIKDKLSAKTKGDSLSLKGTYGVFHTGYIGVVFRDSEGRDVGLGATYDVSPSVAFLLRESLAVPPETRRVDLQLYNSDGRLVGTLDSQILSTTDVELNERVKSHSIKSGLLKNYPNPFNVNTVVPFTTAMQGQCELTVFNLLGQKVRTLIQGRVAGGEWRAVWDGRDDEGDEASSGVYLCQLVVNGAWIGTRKLVLMR